MRPEIPEFLDEHIVHCKKLVHTRNIKTWLCFSKDLKFYEFKRKKLLHSIDLDETCLQKVRTRLRDYKEERKNYVSGVDEDAKNETNMLRGGYAELEMEMSAVDAEQSMAPQPEIVESITFGKYVYRNFEICKFYFLLQCWDKLVVLERLEESLGLQLTAEYEQVLSYKLVAGNMKFHAIVEIKFENGTNLRTDFHNSSQDDTVKEQLKKSDMSNYKQLLERVQSAKTELHIHKALTQKQFQRLRDTQTFGSNFVRSLKLEEKQMLGRCGDIWIRFTADDSLVLGMPLVNNCAASNLTILKNLKPILKINEEIVKGLNYDYRLYQLRQRFEDLESLETFFQSQDEQLQANTWAEQAENQLMPESFAVLLMRLRTSQIISLEACPLFLCFEIEKQLPVDGLRSSKKTGLFEQQIFLKQLDFQSILRQQQACEVSFKENTLHQDFLTLAMTSIETKMRTKFTTPSDLEKFESLLAQKFDFDEIKRKPKIIETEESHASAEHTFPHFVFFNRKPSSLWHGILALREANSKDTAHPLKVIWKFYTKTEEKAYLLLKLLFNELLLHKCNIEHVECPLENAHEFVIIELENAIRQELSAVMDVIKGENCKKETSMNHEELMRIQMRTDLLASAVIK